MKVRQWIVLLLPIAILAAATGLAVVGTSNDAWNHEEAEVEAGAELSNLLGPVDPYAVRRATTGELPEESPGIIGTPIGELLTAGPPPELSGLVGSRAILVVDAPQALADVAFWIGTPPDDLLVVVGREVRYEVDRAVGGQVTFGTLPGAQYVTLSGVVEPVPYPEAMYSWALTRRDAALLDQRGVYLRIDTVVSTAPHVEEPQTPEEVDEHGRQTAPPPGEEVETPLGLPPPLP